MRVAALFGLGCSEKDLEPFRRAAEETSNGSDWRIGLPPAGDSPDAILLFGGDGTIHRYLSALVKLGRPVLVVSAGSGNDFARGLGLRRVSDSLAAWRRFCLQQGNTHKVDLGVVTSTHLEVREYFCTVAGIGLSSEVARRANALPRWLRGHGGYALTLIPSIFQFAALPMKTFSRDQNHDWQMRSDEPALLAAFANTPTFGGSMKIAPNAKSNDGLLDACVIAGIDMFKLFCMFPTVYSGRHLRVKGVEYFQSERVRVESEHPLDIYADGEFVCRTPAEIYVEREALRIIQAASKPQV